MTRPVLQQRSVTHRVPGLVDDQRGSAAIEFALLAPMMLTLFFGSFEVTNLLMLNLKLTAATEDAANLLAQTRSTNNNVTTTDLSNFATAATMEMTPYSAAPYSTAGLQLAFASVSFPTASGPATLVWHYELNSATEVVLNQTVLETLNNGTTTDSAIIVSSQITYTSPLSYVLGTSYTLTDIAYNRPRYVTSITCTSCP
jgi:Flp pilus assembly protein TadG